MPPRDEHPQSPDIDARARDLDPSGYGGTPFLASVGYGHRSWGELLELLQRYRIDVLVDVRSRPYSRANPSFSRDALERTCAESGLEYRFMGDRLGGKPDDAPTANGGRVNYRELEVAGRFRGGLRRLYGLARNGHRVAVMCSELRPEACHRTKLIGEALARYGVALKHIDADGSLVSQSDVVERLTKGQKTLGGSTAFLNHSRGKVL